MSREATKTLIEQFEERRESRVLVYMTGNRGAIGAQMGNDAVRVTYDHLRTLGKVEKLDLVLCNHGGDIGWSATPRCCRGRARSALGSLKSKGLRADGGGLAARDAGVA